MLKIYTRLELVKQPIIRSIDAFMREVIKPCMINDRDKYFMQEIDKATIVDVRNMAINTPFGITTIYNISNGCKTLIVANHLALKDINIEPRVLNLTNCGSNAFTLFLKYYYNSNLVCYTKFTGCLFKEDFSDELLNTSILLNNQSVSIGDFENKALIELENMKEGM